MHGLHEISENSMSNFGDPNSSETVTFTEFLPKMREREFRQIKVLIKELVWRFFLVWSRFNTLCSVYIFRCETIYGFTSLQTHSVEKREIVFRLLVTNGLPCGPLESGIPSPHLPILACNMDLQWMAESTIPRFGHGTQLPTISFSIYKLNDAFFFIIQERFYCVWKTSTKKLRVNL